MTFVRIFVFCAIALHLSAQATQVKDINPGTADAYTDAFSDPSMPIIVWQGRAFFAASNGANGRELWVSDGTEAGTVQLKDINPGALGSNPSAFFVYKNRLYFAATNASNSRELWVSDGTEAGTVLFRDIRPGAGSSSPLYFCLMGDLLYFSAAGPNGSELWRTDGTAQGTLEVVDLPSSSSGSGPSFIVAIGNRLFFEAENVDNGNEVFVSDGTTAGTKVLKDITGNSRSSFPENLRVANGKLYFNAYTDFANRRRAIFVSDGTTEGTTILRDQDGFNDVLEFKGKTIIATANRLFLTDGTPAGTQQLINLGLLYIGNELRQVAVVGDLIYFAGEQQFTTGQELYVSDGTPTGTKLVKDMYAGFLDAEPRWFTVAGNRLFYVSDFKDELVGTGSELAESNGTAAGTRIVADIRPGIQSSAPSSLVLLNNKTLLFLAQTNETGRELWKYTFTPTTPSQDLNVAQDLLQFYPNPAPKGAFQLRSLRPELGTGTWSISDLQGRVLQQEVLKAGESRSIELPKLTRGVYFLRFLQGNFIQTEKLLITE